MNLGTFFSENWQKQIFEDSVHLDRFDSIDSIADCLSLPRSEFVSIQNLHKRQRRERRRAAVLLLSLLLLLSLRSSLV